MALIGGGHERQRWADASMNGGQTVPMGALPQTLTGKWLLPGGPRNAIAFHGHQDANLRRPLAASTPTRPFEEPDRGEWVQTKLLHLIGDFSQPAILQDMSGNSVKISKTYFQNCTASSNPGWSASKSSILQRELLGWQFARHSRRLALAFARLLN